MLKDKMKNTKAGRTSAHFKKALVSSLMRDMLKRAPELDAVQVRRVFSYGYQLMRGSQAHTLYSEAKASANLITKGIGNL